MIIEKKYSKRVNVYQNIITFVLNKRYINILYVCRMYVKIKDMYIQVCMEIYIDVCVHICTIRGCLLIYASYMLKINQVLWLLKKYFTSSLFIY